MTSPSTGTRHSLRAPVRRRRFFAVLAGSLLASWVAMAAVVSMHPPSGGGELRIPVMLYGDSDEYVSGLQFDLAYDPTQFELVGITAGDAATGAGKEVILSETVPGQGRVLVTGFNNNGMADGQIATLTLRPLNGSAAQHDISLGQVLASDPDGNSVPIDYADLFQYPPAPPLNEEEVPAPEDTGSEPIDEPTDGSPDEESPADPGTTDGGAPEPDGNGRTSTNSGAFGNGLSGLGDSRQNSSNADQDGVSTNSASRPLGAAPDSGVSGRSTGGTSRLGNSDERVFSTDRDGRTVGRPASTATTPPEKNGARPPQPGAPKSGGATIPREGDSAAPTEMALLRPASGLIDPPAPAGQAAYTLAMNPAAITETAQGTRAVVAVLTVSLTLALLALAHMIFGRLGRPFWRKSR